MGIEMSSLLDKVLDSKDNPTVDSTLSPKNDEAHKLADGSIVYDSTIAAINRVFDVNPHIYKKQTARGEKIYIGQKPIKLESVYDARVLIKGDWEPKTDWQLIFFKNKILELAPEISFEGIKITDDLFWDREASILKRITEEDNIRSIS